jgi:hypothetical protein
LKFHITAAYARFSRTWDNIGARSPTLSTTAVIMDGIGARSHHD